jgi:predicted enzyme related to lactoylglutathione lyase
MRFRQILACVVTIAVLWNMPAVPDASPGAAPQTPGANAPVGKFVWHDLVTSDPAKCREFYGQLFGWTFEPAEGIDPGYTMIHHEGRPIGGIVFRPPQKGETFIAQWLPYVVVADVDKAANAFRQGGGRIFRGPLNARKDLRVAGVEDAQGAPLGLASRGPQIDEDTLPPLNRWFWMDYVARDADAALKFYGEVLGFTHEIRDTRENFTYYLLKSDRPRAGLFPSPWKRETSVWLSYVRVADPAAMAARAVQLGGTIGLAPDPAVRNGSLAIVVDPTGAPLALQKYPFAAGATQ